MTKSLDEISQQIRHMEEDDRLMQRHCYLGIAIWPILRPVLAQSMRNFSNPRLSQTECILSEKTTLLRKDGIKILERDSTTDKRMPVFIANSSDIRIKSIDTYNSIYFGSLPQRLPGSEVIEIANHAEWDPARGNINYNTIGSLNYWRHLAALQSVKYGTSSEIVNLTKKLHASLSRHGLDHFMTESRILSMLSRFASEYSIYRNIWKVISPSVIVLICSYGKNAMIAAARSLGVDVIELQHGNIYSGHFGYSYSGGNLGQGGPSPFPSIFAAYGQFSFDSMAEYGFWNFPGSELVLTGCVEFDRARAKAAQITKDSKLSRITFTSTGAHEAHELRALIGELALLLRTSVEWEFVVRLHPLNDFEEDWTLWNKRSISNQPQNVRIKVSAHCASEATTNELLASSIWNISTGSSCHFEALALGIPSIVVAKSELPRFYRIIDEKTGSFCVTTSKECSDLINRTQPMSVNVIPEYFYCNNGEKNLQLLIKNFDDARK